jgi:hypothetical protein
VECTTHSAEQQAKSFEIALFGRVSSGKSSLLNAVLETNLLPIGVTPVTAVPTRIAEQYVVPWLDAEQARAETEYRRAESRFVNIGSDFLKKLSESGVPELARMPNALDSDKGFRAPSWFTFEGLIHVAQPASPLRYLADVFLGAVRIFSVIERDALEFLDHLLEMNSTRVQSDVVARVQESRGQLEVEIRILLHEVSRIAENALEHARTARADGAYAVEAALARLNCIEREVLILRVS